MSKHRETFSIRLQFNLLVMISTLCSFFTCLAICNLLRCGKLRKLLAKYYVTANIPNCFDLQIILFLGSFAKLRKMTITYIMPARLPACPPARLPPCLTATRRISIKFDIWVFFFFENLSKKFKYRFSLTRIMDTLHGNLTRSIHFRMRTFQAKAVE